MALGSVLGLVGPVSVLCDCMRQQGKSAESADVFHCFYSHVPEHMWWWFHTTVSDLIWKCRLFYLWLIRLQFCKEHVHWLFYSGQCGIWKANAQQICLHQGITRPSLHKHQNLGLLDATMTLNEGQGHWKWCQTVESTDNCEQTKFEPGPPAL